MDARDAVGALLRDRLGLNLALVRADELDRLARKYGDRPARDAAAFQELVEEAVVAESWFFRDGQPFECLRGYARGRGPLRMLSVPCGTGEEPLSMALTLLDAGRDDFRIDAFDVSRRALERAAAGVYGASSFRETTALARACQRFFVPEGGRFRAAEAARALVSYGHGNLAAADFLPGRVAVYDVVFCRNLLIYLTDEARSRAMTTLTRLLKPGGLLYLGHTEGRAGAGGRLVPLDPAYPFAFTVSATRGEPAFTSPLSPAQGGEGPGVKGRDRSQPPHPRPLSPEYRGEGRKQEQPDAPLARQAQPDLQHQARLAADAGRLDEAADLCERLLKDAQTAAVSCLLGIVRQAQRRDDDARRCFERALYLDPGHHEALVHLALLAERRGDSRQAAHYRRRAARREKA